MASDPEDATDFFSCCSISASGFELLMVLLSTARARDKSDEDDELFCSTLSTFLKSSSSSRVALNRYSCTRYKVYSNHHHRHDFMEYWSVGGSTPIAFVMRSLVSPVFSHTLIVPAGLASALVVVGPSDGDAHCMAVEHHFWGHAETACQTSRSLKKSEAPP